MTDLYATLEVPRDADKAAVRKAYRRAAKKTHPDAGGSRETFALVKLALDCLSDDGRRARYDATGEPGEAELDQTEASALQCLVQTMNSIVDELVAKNADPSRFDLVALTRQSVEQSIGQANNELQRFKKQAEQARAIAKRVKPKGVSADRIGPLLADRAVQAERRQETVEKAVAVMRRALAILNEHTFDVEPAPNGVIGFMNGVPIYGPVRT